MHAALLFIFALFLLDSICEKALSCINLRHLRLHGAVIPPGFEAAIDGDKLREMRDYTLAREKVALLSSLWQDALVAFFFFGGLLGLYSGWIDNLGLAALPTVLLFFVLLSYADTLLQLPFRLYSTFVVEKRFGFNRQTIKLWLADFCKSTLIGTVLICVLLAAAFWLIELLPQRWWMAVWLLFCSFSILMLYLVPYVIEPLFNKFSPIADAALEERLREVLARAGLRVSRVFSMDASKRSGHSNAYFSGLGRVKRIVLFDTLLTSHTHDEIAAILAHEAGHWKKKHIAKRLLSGAALAFIVCWLLAVLSRSGQLALIFGLPRAEIHVRLLLAGFLLSLCGLPFAPLSSWYSRRHEREADRFAVRLMGESSSLASALVKLGVDNLANLHPHPLYATIYYSHPPLVERVQGLQGRAEGKRQNAEGKESHG